MNIFHDYSCFTGADETVTNEKYPLHEIFAEANDIRKRLGTKGYLFDTYLKLVFTAMSAVCPDGLASLGTDLYGELTSIVRDVLDDNKNNHLFYDKAKDFIKTHPLTYQEACTKVDIYTIALFDKFLGYVFRNWEYHLKLVSQNSYDSVWLDNLYKEIVSLLSSSAEMDILNLMLAKKFIAVYPVAELKQALIAELLNDLLAEDEESNRRIFQIVMAFGEEFLS